MEPLVELKAYMIPVAALIPLVIGFVWYNPKVFGKAWMDACGLTEEKLEGANMPVIFLLSYVFANLIGFTLTGLAVHQMGLQSMVMGADEATIETARQLLESTSDNYRTFKHGALHGFFAGFTIAFTVLATNALFERKSWKYIWINSGYWIVSMTLMGGVLCAFA